MRRVVLSHVCGLSSVLMLAGCDALIHQWPSIIGREPPGGTEEPGEPVAPRTEHASTFLPIENGRVLSASTQGFRIIDLRDPEVPHVEGAIAFASEKLELYRTGDHVILVATYPRGYEGERQDVPVRRADYPSASLFNVDIRDRERPTVINELQVEDLPRHSVLRKSPEGDALFLLPMIWDGEHYQSRVDRYELRDGVLVQTGQLALDGVAEAIAATPERLLAATSGADQEDDLSTVSAVDITQSELRIAYSTSFVGRIGTTSQLMVSDDQLRVLYVSPDSASSIATFQLDTAPAAQPSGVCTLGAGPDYSDEAYLFSANAPELFVSSAGSTQLERVRFDASGACPDRSAYGPESRGVALHELEHERVLVLGASDLRLYDSASPPEAALLARAEVEARLATGDREVLQVTPLQQPAAASDGTNEPLLASVLSTSPDYHSRYELLTLSDATLSARGVLDTRGAPKDVALLGRTLVAVSSTELRTFDARDLDRPRALGQLELAERYREVFALGDYVVRIRQHPAVLPPGERARAVHDDLQVMPRGGSEAVASLPVESEGLWFQLRSVLVNAQLTIAEYGSESERKARVAIQAYDVSDPAAPRRAGAMSTTEIDAEWTTGHFYEPSVSYLVVGDALVIPQRKRLSDLHVRQCWKTVDYDACRGNSAPDCEPEKYTGTLYCRTLETEPEVCTADNLTHCDADGCERLDVLPAGIPSAEDGCNEYEELGRATTFAFNVIDLRDADAPRLLRPLFELPDDLSSHQYMASGTRIYATEQDGDALLASAIDFSDPAAPQLTPRQSVLGRIAAAVGDDMYIGPAEYNHSELTLTRLRCCGGAQPSATRSWTARSLVSLQPDAAGHLLLMHAQAESSEPAPDPQASWTRLEILDQATLATIGSLDIDKYASALLDPRDGRLVVDGSGVLYIVDVRNAQLPRVQAAVPYGTVSAALDGVRLTVTDELGFRSYSVDLSNMIR